MLHKLQIALLRNKHSHLRHKLPEKPKITLRELHKIKSCRGKFIRYYGFERSGVGNVKCLSYCYQFKARNY